MDYFTSYLEYVGRTEAPVSYHRWTSIGIIGALVGRKLHIPFGHGKIYPNQYIQLMGAPGTRKSTAISIGKRLLKDAGFNRFAPDRMSKERFLMEMKPVLEEELDGDLTLLAFDQPAETFVVAEEFGDFLGPGNMEFATMLTKLWDNVDSYEHPKIHGKSVVVDKPTVNILSGNTPQGLALSVPAEALGNGFMSRMLFVYARETGIKITFPDKVDRTKHDLLVEHLVKVKELEGEVAYSEQAVPVLERIYTEYTGLDDPRFTGYSTRRFTHLLKLCLIFAAANLRTTITKEDAINANTFLHYTEIKMPKALGEFGRSKYSDISNIICDALSRTHKPLSHNDLWKLVAKDLSKTSELGDIVKGLMAAQKIQVITIAGKQGYMPLHTELKEWDPSLLNEDFITDQEKYV